MYLRNGEKDERFDSMDKRCINAAERGPILLAKTREMTMDELTGKLLERKIPAGPVCTLEKILGSDYVRYHRLVMEVKDCQNDVFQVIGCPLKFSQFPVRAEDFVSMPGEFTKEVLEQKKRETAPSSGGDAPPGESAEDERPLAGIRILDLTRFMAGPLGTQILENPPAFAEAVMESCPDVQTAMPVKYQTGRYQNGFHSGDALLFGVDENMGQVLDVDLLSGRLLTAGEANGQVRRTLPVLRPWRRSSRTSGKRWGRKMSISSCMISWVMALAWG